MYQSILFLRIFSSASVHSSSMPPTPFDEVGVFWPGSVFSSSETVAFSRSVDDISMLPVKWMLSSESEVPTGLHVEDDIYEREEANLGGLRDL